MSQTRLKITRPQRWDSPFDPNMDDRVIDALIRVSPFIEMPESAFTEEVPLRGILKNDCRVFNLLKGDLIVREGDYGSSAFLILEGEAIVSLRSLPDTLLGRQSRKHQGWKNVWKSLLNPPKYAEVRDYREQHKNKPADSLSTRQSGDQTRVFLHDIPRVLRPSDTAQIRAGEIFGEVSALTRTPRSSTVIANSDMQVLEIRWQGFRELMKRHPSMREHIERLYRENSLNDHLRETPLFRNLSALPLQRLAEQIVFETYGTFQWNANFKSTREQDIAERILAEPIIVQEGDYVNGLLLIRNGFARLSRQHGQGHQTIAYLGKGQIVGLREIVHNWKTGEQRPWLLSLRALGYVDVLRLPTQVAEKLLLPCLDETQMPPPLPTLKELQQGRIQRQAKRQESLDPGLIEFLVENRLINGTQAMVIDLDRCTRCDDCVRACASTHDNNPRFNRSGKIHDKWMIAHACMHCLDPVCMIGCPTGAIGRETESGVVTINDLTCIGCGTCANSCPYENIQMVGVTSPQGLPLVDPAGLPIVKATKCDLCVNHHGAPACQRACPHDALVRLDLSTTDPMQLLTKR